MDSTEWRGQRDTPHINHRHKRHKCSKPPQEPLRENAAVKVVRTWLRANSTPCFWKGSNALARLGGGANARTVLSTAAGGRFFFLAGPPLPADEGRLVGVTVKDSGLLLGVDPDLAAVAVAGSNRRRLLGSPDALAAAALSRSCSFLIRPSRGPGMEAMLSIRKRTVEPDNPGLVLITSQMIAANRLGNITTRGR